MTELEIPRAALDAHDPTGLDDDREAVHRIAAPVVAAELRRIADGFDKIAAGSHGWVIRADAVSLRARADELDGADNPD